MIVENAQNNLIRMAIAQVFQVSSSEVTKIFRDLESAYTKGRWYHNLDHIGDMLRQLEYHYPLDDPYAVKAAILFHDYIYDPSRMGRGYTGLSNEAQSAIICKNIMEKYRLGKETVQRAADLIKMTEAHEAPWGDHEAQLFLDIDMLVLAAPEERYRRYASSVAMEFLTAFTPEQYEQGRRRFLSDISMRDHVFLSEKFVHLEDRVFENLAWEDANLKHLIQSAMTRSPRTTAPALQI